MPLQEDEHYKVLADAVSDKFRVISTLRFILVGQAIRVGAKAGEYTGILKGTYSKDISDTSLRRLSGKFNVLRVLNFTAISSFDI